jgi:hypothetical protein
MSVVLLTLLAATVVAALVLLVAMLVKDKPFYGAMGVCVLAGPGTVLAFMHLALG